jgi:Fe-S cluster biosynthesis and repair protein YggX
MGTRPGRPREANVSTATVHCAKLGQDLPAIDPNSPLGRRALKMAKMIGGEALAQRIQAEISMKGWELWNDHMVMLFNEYRLDPSSEESNKVLRGHLDAFFFGQQKTIDNYVPPPK